MFNVAVALLVLPALPVPKALAGQGAGKQDEIRIVRDVSYWHGRDPSPERHKLDLYLPEGKKDFPVVVFVHGGAWVVGDKGFFGWGDAIGKYFARHGIAAVMPSYRLAPAARNADQARDVARAVAWTRDHIRNYGGAPDRLFLCGHSAGGQLVSLLATDPDYLKAEGVALRSIQGVIAVSAVFRAPEISKALVRVQLFDAVFGTDADARRKASPLYQVHSGVVPFLILYAEHELPTLAEDARAMAAALEKARCRVECREVHGRDHESVMFRARSDDDPVARRIERFVLGGAAEARATGPAGGVRHLHE